MHGWIQVLEALQRAVDVRCKCIDTPEGLQRDDASNSGLAPAPVLVLFSGGVDSTLLAACSHRALPPDAPIDLASICFDGGASPDRSASTHVVNPSQQYGEASVSVILLILVQGKCCSANVWTAGCLRWMRLRSSRHLHLRESGD